MIPALKLVAGLVILTLGAELLIRSSVKLALAARQGSADGHLAKIDRARIAEDGVGLEAPARGLSFLQKA